MNCFLSAWKPSLTNVRFNRVKGTVKALSTANSSDSLSAFPDAINALLEAKVALDRITRYLNQPEVVFTTEDDVSDRISLREATLAWPVSEDAADSPEPVHLFKMRDMTLEIPTGQFTLVCGPLGSGKTLLVRLQPVLATDPSSELYWAKHASKPGRCWRPVVSPTRRPCTARTSVGCGRMRAGSMNPSRTRHSRRTSVMGRYGTTSSLVNPCGRRGTRRFFGSVLSFQIWTSCRTAISLRSANTASIWCVYPSLRELR